MRGNYIYNPRSRVLLELGGVGGGGGVTLPPVQVNIPCPSLTMSRRPRLTIKVINEMRKSKKGQHRADAVGQNCELVC